MIATPRARDLLLSIRAARYDCFVAVWVGLVGLACCFSGLGAGLVAFGVALLVLFLAWFGTLAYNSTSRIGVVSLRLFRPVWRSRRSIEEMIIVKDCGQRRPPTEGWKTSLPNYTPRTRTFIVADDVPECLIGLAYPYIPGREPIDASDVGSWMAARGFVVWPSIFDYWSTPQRLGHSSIPEPYMMGLWLLRGDHPWARSSRARS